MQHALNHAGKATRVHLDSAGVDSHHIGHAPDVRSQETALRKGVDISHLRARNVRPEDFSQFELILAMDESHLSALKKMAAKLSAEKATATLALYLPYAGITHRSEVPDPYYGANRDFQDVYGLIDEATQNLISRL